MILVPTLKAGIIDGRPYSIRMYGSVDKPEACRVYVGGRSYMLLNVVEGEQYPVLEPEQEYDRRGQGT